MSQDITIYRRFWTSISRLDYVNGYQISTAIGTPPLKVLYVERETDCIHSHNLPDFLYAKTHLLKDPARSVVLRVSDGSQMVEPKVDERGANPRRRDLGRESLAPVPPSEAEPEIDIA